MATCWLALGLAACAVGPAMAAPSRLCFMHVGPQDKPMPEFCLARPPGAPGDLPVADETIWQAVLATCHESAPGSMQQQPGSYRVTADRDWPPHLVAPAAMRSLAATLIDASRRQGAAPPAAIEQLARRLASD